VGPRCGLSVYRSEKYLASAVILARSLVTIPPELHPRLLLRTVYEGKVIPANAIRNCPEPS